MICERCANEIADNAIICPVCGYHTRQASAHQSFSTYESYARESYYQSPPGNAYEQGYREGASIPPSSQQGYASSSSYQYYGNAQPYNAPPFYQQPVFMTPVPNPEKNDSALIVEFICSLFGIFGVGWLIARETTVGVILLICSFVLYWPLMFLGTILTIGIGLICLGPLAITLIIVNALLLNSALKRKAAQFMIMQQPPVQMPPYMPNQPGR